MTRAVHRPVLAAGALALMLAGCADHPADPPLAAHSDPQAAAIMPAGAEAERRLLARDSGGNWADPAPLAALSAQSPQDCAGTPEGTACALSAPAAEGGVFHRSLAATHDGRCVAVWGGGMMPAGASAVAVLTLHRQFEFGQPRFQRLYFLLNPGTPLDATPRLTDPRRFARYCLTLLQPDRMVKRVGED